MRRLIACLAILLAIISGITQVRACDLCPGAQSSQPLSAEMATAKVVVFGAIVKSRLGGDGFSGTSELGIEAPLKLPPEFKDQKTVVLTKYAPPDPKQKYLVFADLRGRELDPYRVIPCTSDRIVKYLQEAPPWMEKGKEPEKRAQRLVYYYRYLNDLDADLANDAFKEWATSSNREVGIVANKLNPAELRAWLMDTKTPSARLGLYAYLLGACGGDRDAELLRGMILQPDARTGPALDGLLAGYVQLRPEDGWKLTHEVIQDGKRNFTQRHAVLRMLRFHYGYQGEAARQQIITATGLLLQQADVNDLAVEQLRAWKLWHLTNNVLALYGSKDADAPITKRAIVRYALSCPEPRAKQFIENLKKNEGKLVSEVEEQLTWDMPAPKTQ